MSVMAWSQTPENPVVYQDCDRNGLNVNYVAPHALSSDGTIQDHEYVDLGLPSGTKWATCNIGADTPEELGDIFQWAGVIPGAEGNEPYYNGNSWTKYCTDTTKGQVDNKTVLEAVDDAATYNWGSRWSVPTKEQWEELKYNSFARITKRYGVDGVEFQSKINGKRIFMKASWMYYNSADDINYWTSTLFQSSGYSDNYGYAVWFKDYNFNNDGSASWSITMRYRSYGYCIRPVCH